MKKKIDKIKLLLILAVAAWLIMIGVNIVKQINQDMTELGIILDDKLY